MDPPDSHTDTHAALEAVADATLLVDNHAHPFYIPDQSTSHYVMPCLSAVLTENKDVSARGTLSFCRSLRDLHALVVSGRASCRSSETSEEHMVREEEEDCLSCVTEMERTVESTRAHMGPWNLAKRCFAAAGIAAVLIDDGIECPEGARPVQLREFPQRLNVPVAKRVLRLESEAEHTLRILVSQNENGLWRHGRKRAESPDKRPRTTLRAQRFRREFRKRIDPLPLDVVSFKSIAAYRSGLKVNLDWTDEDLEDALAKLSFSGGGNVRLEDRVIVDCVVRTGLDVAREHAIPIQFHCGFGDNDLDLMQANPLLLRPLFQRYPDVRIVLLHAAWPFTRDAAYLTSVYPGVFLDLGLAIPLLSVRGMFRAVDQALELAPITKLLYSSDAHSVPDAFYLAARWGRRVVASVIASAVISGDLGQTEAKAAIKKILAENAIKLYRLPIYS